MGQDRKERPRIKLATDVDRAQPETTQYALYDSKVAGLSLRISPGGKKAWSLHYRNKAGAPRRLSLGAYPAVSLSHARDAANDALTAVRGGADPAKEKRAARASGKAADASVCALIEGYLADAAKGRHRPNAKPNRASTIAGDRDVFDRFINPELGKIPAKELTRAEVQALIDDVSEDNGPGMARRCATVIRAAFNYGIRRERVTHNPAQLLDVPRPGSRERVLTDAEMKASWLYTAPQRNVEGLSPPMAIALRLAMVTLQRGGEVCGMREDEIDEKAKLWSLPGERTKNGRPHLVPLPPLAIELIREARKLREKDSPYIFPAPRAAGPILRRNFSTAARKMFEALDIKDATAHDFRRTGASNLTGERIGVTRFLVSRVLNQISETGGAAASTGVYDRNEYLGEKRKALEAWAKTLRNIAGI